MTYVSCLPTIVITMVTMSSNASSELRIGQVKLIVGMINRMQYLKWSDIGG